MTNSFNAGNYAERKTLKWTYPHLQAKTDHGRYQITQKMGSAVWVYSLEYKGQLIGKNNPTTDIMLLFAEAQSHHEVRVYIPEGESE